MFTFYDQVIESRIEHAFLMGTGIIGPQIRVCILYNIYKS